MKLSGKRKTPFTGDDYDAAREIVATRLFDYQERSVGKDYDGANGGVILVPPRIGNGEGYSYPPRGNIPRLFHVPHWHTDQRQIMPLIRDLRQRGVTIHFATDGVRVVKPATLQSYFCDYADTCGSDGAALLMALAELLAEEAVAAWLAKSE